MIAAELGVDDYLAEATPEAKRELVRQCQKDGHRVAMCGDGTNDAPALAQADVAVAMNSGTQLAKEAGNLVDLDSNPTKFIAIVETGRQMLDDAPIAHHFSIAAELVKYSQSFLWCLPRTILREHAQRHAALEPVECDSVGSDIQCFRHWPAPLPGSAGSQGTRGSRDVPRTPTGGSTDSVESCCRWSESN